jgi:hypothetical protein
LWLVDPVGLSLSLYCSSSFVLASALLPSLSNIIPKVSREVCVCFCLVVRDPRSYNWDMGQVLLRKNFYRLPFTPPLWSPIRSFNWYQSLVTDHSTLTSLVIHRAMDKSVGDSPRGPLKQRGDPHLNPATTPKHAKPNHAGG